MSHTHDCKCYINELDKWRDRLADILTEKGIPSNECEKFNTLVPKVEQISSGGSGAAQAFVLGNSAGKSIIGNAEVLEV